MKTLILEGKSIPIIKWRVTGTPEKETLKWRFITADGHVQVVEPVQVEYCMIRVDEDCQQIEINTTLGPVRDLILQIMDHINGDAHNGMAASILAFEDFIRKYAWRQIAGAPDGFPEYEWEVDPEVIYEKARNIRLDTFTTMEKVQRLIDWMRAEFSEKKPILYVDCEAFLERIRKEILPFYHYGSRIKYDQLKWRRFVDLYCCEWIKNPRIKGDIEQSVGYLDFLEYYVNYVAYFASGPNEIMLPVKWVAPTLLEMSDEDKVIYDILNSKGPRNPAILRAKRAMAGKKKGKVQNRGDRQKIAAAFFRMVEKQHMTNNAAANDIAKKAWWMTKGNNLLNLEEAYVLTADDVKRISGVKK